MRWLAGMVLAVVVLLGPGPARASAAQPARPGPSPPGALVLVERLTMDEALAAAGPRRPQVAGFVATLPVHQPLASRVLSLAAGRRVDALDALEADPAAASGLPGPATVQRIRADNPGAELGRLPSTRVLATPGLEVAGLFTLGPAGPARPPRPLPPGDRPLPMASDRLLVVAVPDAGALAGVLGRLRPPPGVARSVMVAGLRAAPGRANAAPLLVFEEGLERGLPTSRSTRRPGLVALEDVRPTLGGGVSTGDDGSGIEVVPDDQPDVAATRLDRRVAALVAARTWAIPLLCLAAVLALFALLRTWRAGNPARPVPPAPAAGSGAAAGSGGAAGPARAARGLLALTLALPSGYLIASMAEPAAARLWQEALPEARGPSLVVPWAVAWVAFGIAAAAALTALALRLDRPAAGAGAGGIPAFGPRQDPRWGSVAEPAEADPRRSTDTGPGDRWGRLPTRAPVVLGAVLLGLVALDLLRGGSGLAQPLLGGSAWDGERFYGLGNGYFAFALAAAMLVIGFAPLPAGTAAGLLAGLGVVDGLPWLGADVGGALTSMLTAAAALVVLAPGRPRGGRAVLLAGLALAAAVAVTLGLGLGGPVTHAGRFAERLAQAPADAAGVVVDQLARNLRLLANSPFAWVGPLQVALAGLLALRPPPPLRDLPGWTRRVLGLGAFGSLLLIVLNDTGVTATAASGLFLLAIPAWAWLEQHHPIGHPPPRPPARPAVGARPPGS